MNKYVYSIRFTDGTDIEKALMQSDAVSKLDADEHGYELNFRKCNPVIYGRMERSWNEQSRFTQEEMDRLAKYSVRVCDNRVVYSTSVPAGIAQDVPMYISDICPGKELDVQVRQEMRNQCWEHYRVKDGVDYDLPEELNVAEDDTSEDRQYSK